MWRRRRPSPEKSLNMTEKLSKEEFWKLMDILKSSDAEWPRDRTQTLREVAKSLTWRRKQFWNKKNPEPRRKKSIEEAINTNVAREQKSQKQLLTLWKDGPTRTKEEIPDKVFQILQKQHGVGEDDS
jgi:hypothetical protein